MGRQRARRRPPPRRDRSRPSPHPGACGRAAGGGSCDAQPCDPPRVRGGQSAAAFLPSRKKVARTHSCLSASRTAAVVPGHGPSSKVSTTSLSASGRVAGKCLRPTLGVAATSTASTRDVPRASGLPAQVACASARAPYGSAASPIKVMIRNFVTLHPIGIPPPRSSGYGARCVRRAERWQATAAAAG